MKALHALAIVLSSLALFSCVSSDGPSASLTPTGPAMQSEESSIAIGQLLQAHHEYLAHVSNAGGAVAPSSVNCN